MSISRDDDPKLAHRAAPDAHAETRPTDALYADRAGGTLGAGHVDATAPHVRPRNTRWGRIALIAGAVILSVAVVSAFVTGVGRDGTELATTAPAEPLVTGTAPDGDTVVVADPDPAAVPASDTVIVPAD